MWNSVVRSWIMCISIDKLDLHRGGMASSAWLRYIAVIVLIGCCSCKVVLITDHRNGMREKDRQKEVSSKQRQRQVWVPTDLHSRTDISEMGLIGRGTNGQIFGTLLSDTNDGISAPQQSIENFIDSFSTLFRPLSSQESSIPNTEDNAGTGDEIDFRQGEIISPRSGAGNIGSTDNRVSMTRAFPGQRDFSPFLTDVSDDTPVRIAGTSSGVSGTANIMSDTAGFDDSIQTTAFLGQRDRFADDGSLFVINQGQNVRGPVTIVENDDTFIRKQGVRIPTEISLGQRRPSLLDGENMRFNQVQDFGEINERTDSSSSIQSSNIDDMNSLFNARVDSSTGPITGQNGDIVSENVAVGLSTRNQDRPTQQSSLRTDDTSAGSLSASSLGNSLISNLLSRIFSTPSRANEDTLTEIGNTLDRIDASESGSQQQTQTASSGVLDNTQITTGGQRGATGGFTEQEGKNTAVLFGSNGMRTFSQKDESQKTLDDRKKSNVGKRLNNQLAKSQRNDDIDMGLGQTAKRVLLSGKQLQTRKLPSKSLVNGSRPDSRKSIRMMFPSKTRPSSKSTSNTAKSRKINGIQHKSDSVDSINIKPTRSQFKSRGPYMVFQTSKSSHVKSGGSINFNSPGIPSAAFIPSRDNNSFRRIRPSFSGTSSMNNQASGNQIRRTASQIPTSVTVSQSRTGGSGNNDRSSIFGLSGSNLNFPQSAVFRDGSRQNQGNTASASSGTLSAQSSNWEGAAGIASLTRSEGNLPIPVRVFMILPNSASGSTSRSSGVISNPSAIGKSRTKQVSMFKSNFDSPFALPSVSMGSTSNLRGSGLPARVSAGTSGRSLSTSFGRGGGIRSTAPFSRRLPGGGNGRITTNLTPKQVISSMQKVTFQGRMNTATGRNTVGRPSQPISSRSGMPATKRTVKNSGTY